MSYRHLLVNMGQPASQTRARLAAALAKMHGAYLLGRHYSFERRGSGPGATQVSPARLGGEAVAAASAETPATDPEQKREMRQAHEMFDQAAKDAGVAADFEALPGGNRPLWECLLEDARCTDLTLVGKPGGGQSDRDLIKNLTGESGSPVLVVPESADETPGSRHVVVAWNGTAEAARAVRGAIPMIEAAKQVTILMIKPKAAARSSAPRLQLLLEKHGATVEIKEEGAEMRTSDTLISRAEESGADVVVMGAFGRARLREMITGGATTGRTIESATVPLLMTQ